MEKKIYSLVLGGLLAAGSFNLFSMVTPPAQPIKSHDLLVFEFNAQAALAVYCRTIFPNPMYPSDVRHAHLSASVEAINRAIDLAQRIEDNGPIRKFTLQAYELKVLHNEAFDR